MSKTILVIYTNSKIKKESDIRKAKKYAFNTSSNLNEKDLIDSKDYNSYMQVVKVLDKSYKYYNASNGDLSDEFTSTSQWTIKNLEIREDLEDIVYGSIVKENK